MSKIALVTGGAGFIGSYLVPRLIKEGFTVRVLDNLTPQIHGSIPRNCNWLNDKGIVFIRDSILSLKTLEMALQGVDMVIHLAAETGTGQSMYEISKYFETNVQGTANILEILQNNRSGHSVRSLIIASSRAIYGEGSYKCSEHGSVFPAPRTSSDMSKGDWDLYCPECGETTDMEATQETAPYSPMSLYALTKQVQEQAVLMHSSTNRINGFALRYQNVYGPGQSLNNPYTGILSIFSNLARQGQPIDVYEDGLESRDFVYIDDIVEATLRAAMYDGSFVGALNVGTGVAIPVLSVAKEINKYFGNQSEIRISGKYRIGDIRHNKAATRLLEEELMFKPCVPFEDGLHKFLEWAAVQPLENKTAYQSSVAELQNRGLMRHSDLEGD